MYVCKSRMQSILNYTNNLTKKHLQKPQRQEQHAK